MHICSVLGRNHICMTLHVCNRADQNDLRIYRGRAQGNPGWANGSSSQAAQASGLPSSSGELGILREASRTAGLAGPELAQAPAPSMDGSAGSAPSVPTIVGNPSVPTIVGTVHVVRAPAAEGQLAPAAEGAAAPSSITHNAEWKRFMRAASNPNRFSPALTQRLGQDKRQLFQEFLECGCDLDALKVKVSKATTENDKHSETWGWIRAKDLALTEEKRKTHVAKRKAQNRTRWDPDWPGDEDEMWVWDRTSLPSFTRENVESQRTATEASCTWCTLHACDMCKKHACDMRVTCVHARDMCMSVTCVCVRVTCACA